MSDSNAMVMIDGQAYPVDTLSKAAKQQILNLRVTDQEIARLRQSLAIATTARASYAQALSAELSNSNVNTH